MFPVNIVIPLASFSSVLLSAHIVVQRTAKISRQPTCVLTTSGRIDFQWRFSYINRLPVSRYILTKSVGRFDDEGDDDCQDITNMYRDNEISDDERFTIFNSCRGVCKDTPAFEYQVGIQMSSLTYLLTLQKHYCTVI